SFLLFLYRLEGNSVVSIVAFKQIVTLGMPSVSPTEKVGQYVRPREWNKLISDPDTVSCICFCCRFQVSVTLIFCFVWIMPELKP
ncbi:hypothetical protein Q8G71_34445, partial [Klebsiella pneumoniae]